ncbi:hypothetical protein TorRG33x02_168560, partial [Trema orientale]
DVDIKSSSREVDDVGSLSLRELGSGIQVRKAGAHLNNRGIVRQRCIHVGVRRTVLLRSRALPANKELESLL